MAIPQKIAERLANGLKRYQQVVTAAKSRDINESDTVTIIKDILADVFGYDKYTEITSEYAIRGTYCDLAIKLGGELRVLIEAKAIGIDLKEQHVKQAVDYAANQGVDWVVLTNGEIWRVYRVLFTKPINQELVVEFNLTSLRAKPESDLEILYLLARESWAKSLLGEYHTQKQALSRFMIGAILRTQTTLDLLRRELRKLAPGVKIETAEIAEVLETEVIKREVMEGEKAEEARKKVLKAQGDGKQRTTKPEVPTLAVDAGTPAPSTAGE